MLRFLIAAASVAAVLLPVSASAQDSRYRQIDQFGGGNCVFSPQELLRGEENSPAYRQITDTFEDGQDIYVRCFYADTLQTFFNEGVAYNSLRDDADRFFELVWMRPESISGSVRDYKVDGYYTDVTSRSRNWDQERISLTRSDCSFEGLGSSEISPNGSHPNGCLHLGNFIRLQAAQHNLSLPRVSEFCLQAYFEKADEYQIIQRGNALVQEPNTYRRRLAIGCFSVEVDA